VQYYFYFISKILVFCLGEIRKCPVEVGEDMDMDMDMDMDDAQRFSQG
jgi:hypothetical protein